MRLPIRLAVIAPLSCLVAPAGCTPSKRGVQVGAQPAQANITMVGMDPRFAADENVVYEMSTCVAPFNGAKGEGGVVSFKAPGLKKAAQCQIKVKTLVANPPGITFNTEPAVLYWARSVTLSEDTAGALAGIALLQQTYSVEVPQDPAKVFTVSAPVKFPSEVLPPPPVTARLDCTPAITNPGSFKATSAMEGDVTFVIELGTDTKFKCTNIWIGAAGDGFLMVGKWLPDGAAIEVAAGSKVSLPKVDLATVAPPVVDNGAVQVVTKPGDCGAGKVFNSMTRQCE